MKKLSFILMVLSVFFTCVSFAAAEPVLDVIMNAGTVQAFTDEKVASDDLRAILKAGLSTASAINQQPWFLVAVTNSEVMDKLASSGSMPGNMPAGVHSEAPAGVPAGAPEGGAMPSMPAAGTAARAALGDSPAAIIVYMDGNTKSPNAAYDCGLASQNMYIAASALGYGVKIVSSPTRILNGEEHDSICEMLGVDTSLQAIAVLLIGTPAADTVTSASTRASLEEKTAVIE